jgi:hypothetical protein
MVCRIYVLTEVVLKAATFWNIALCRPYMNRRFGWTYHLRSQGRKSAEQETGVLADDKDDTLLRNVGSYADYTVLYSWRWRLLKTLHS